MNYISAHRTVSGWPFFCLLLALFTTSLSAQTISFCPPYPRAMDQAYICLTVVDGGNFQLGIETGQRATLHNPIRFVFPIPPKNLTFTINTQHRRRWPQTLPPFGLRPTSRFTFND